MHTVIFPCVLFITYFLTTVSSATYLFDGNGGDAQRSGQTTNTLPTQTLLPGQFIQHPGVGKTHGNPAIINDDVFYIYWNQSGNPYLYAWRADGTISTALLQQAGSDIISDSFDPLLVNEDVAFTVVSSYNSSLQPGDSALAAFDTTTLEQLWVDFPAKAIDAAAFATETDGTVLLLLLSSSAREITMRNPKTGDIVRHASFYGICDFRASLTLDPESKYAYVSCPDKTFGNDRLLSFEIATGNNIFDLVVKGLQSYWPLSLVYWKSANILVGISTAKLWGFDTMTGNILWTHYNPPVTANVILSVAVGGPKDTPLLYLLSQANTGITYPNIYITAINSTGDTVGKPNFLPLNIDQFQSNLLLGNDGLTLTINGWNTVGNNAYPALASVKFDLVNEKWLSLWNVNFPTTSTNGRLALFTVPRNNGSVVTLAWDGIYQYNEKVAIH